MALPQTEITLEPRRYIDAMSAADAVRVLLSGQAAAVKTVDAARQEIENAAVLVAKTLRAGGRLNYVAAGSSALMALADGAELPGTFGIPQSQIRIFMAGGIPTDAGMPGSTEDDTSDAKQIVSSLNATDLVIALSASGATPYPCEISRLARAEGIKIIAIANNPGTFLLRNADVAICLPTPPEVLAGSTRLGAGTAQKTALNTISTLAGVLLGHVHDGMMVNLNVDNDKLRGRAVAMVAKISDVSTEAAGLALKDARQDVKLAVMLAKGCQIDSASKVLSDHNGHLKACLQAFAKN